MKPRIIVIVGPTASGKSGLAIELAKKYNGEILCVDSRTVYVGMDVGTAKPVGRVEGLEGKERVGKGGKGIVGASGRSPSLPLQVEDIPHWGIDLIEPNQEYNGALFKEYAEKVITDIVSRGKLPILVGGTGLWMDIVVDNLESPEVEPDLVLRAELEKRSVEDLFSEYENLDPDGALVIDKKNKRRLVRALEVCKKTGRPFSALRQKGESSYDALWLGIEVEKNVLKARIDHRVDEMIEQGLVNEVINLNKKFGCDVYSMSGIGYQEFCNYLRRGERPLALSEINDITEQIKIHTRQYAKRQMTWFKRNERINWVMGLDEAKILVEKFI